MGVEPHVEVVEYRPALRDAFVRLNRQWIEQYFVIEPRDEAVFADVEGRILAPGGAIFFVLADGVPLGTCAMQVESPGVYQLAKMAVDPAARGRGYGDLLMDAAIAWARARGARRVELLSNTTLAPAIALYRKHGFVEEGRRVKQYRRQSGELWDTIEMGLLLD
jgi:ribosomal protein S18 acetylase RimI-like enzyme